MNKYFAEVAKEFVEKVNGNPNVAINEIGQVMLIAELRAIKHAIDGINNVTVHVDNLPA